MVLGMVPLLGIQRWLNSMVPTPTELIANMETGKMNKPTNKYKITVFEKCNEGKECICEAIMGNVISLGISLGQVL